MSKKGDMVEKVVTPTQTTTARGRKIEKAPAFRGKWVGA